MRRRIGQLHRRPASVSNPFVAQHRLLRRLERDCHPSVPIFLNTSSSWADTYLVPAHQLTQRSIGRMRLDFDMNTEGIQELWFDLETDGPKRKTRAWVETHWLPLLDCALPLADYLSKYLSADCVYISASGTGLHIRSFVRGIAKVEHRDAVLLHLLHSVGIKNSKGKGITGCDYPSTLSIRKKVRAIGASNRDKTLSDKADYEHYCTWIPLGELRTLRGYPFCADAGRVRYPQRYRIADLPEEWRYEALPRRVREEAKKRREQIRKKDVSSEKPVRPLTDFGMLLSKDNKLADLFQGKKPIAGLQDQSRSGRELSLVSKLVWYGFTFEQVDSILRKSRIGKWCSAPSSYRWQTFRCALRRKSVE